jgi:hypothetical protein
MTASELLTMAGDKDVPYMSFKAKALDYLGDQSLEKKADIIAALKERAEDEAPAADEPVKTPAGAVEVNLLKKYAPFFLMDEDTGEWVEQGEVTQQVPAGLAYLREDEAQRVLERGQASPTANTFRQMKG